MPDHRADERVDDDEQRELREVLAEAEPDVRSCACRVSARPWLTREDLLHVGGLRRDVRRARRRTRRASSESIGFQRFSNAMVLDGLPLMPAPHTEPAKWPG